MKIKAKRLLKSVLAVISCGTIAASSSVLNINAYVLDTFVGNSDVQKPHEYVNLGQEDYE